MNVSLGVKPIKIKAESVAVVKKETPSEDYSAWGQESAGLTVDQGTICESSLYLSMNPLTAVDLSPKGILLRPRKAQRKEKVVRKHLLSRTCLREALDHHHLKLGTSQPQLSLLQLLVMCLLISFFQRTMKRIYMSLTPT